MLKLDKQALVHRVYQLTWTLPLRAPAETVECASRTVEDGGRERLWSGCEPKPVSADQMHSSHGAQSHRAQETASSNVCETSVDMAAGVSSRSRAPKEKSYILLWLKACATQQLRSINASTERHHASCTHSQINYGHHTNIPEGFTLL